MSSRCRTQLKRTHDFTTYSPHESKDIEIKLKSARLLDFPMATAPSSHALAPLMMVLKTSKKTSRPSPSPRDASNLLSCDIDAARHRIVNSSDDDVFDLAGSCRDIALISLEFPPRRHWMVRFEPGSLRPCVRALGKLKSRGCRAQARHEGKVDPRCVAP